MSFKIQNPFAAIVAKTKAAKKKVEQQQRNLLEAVGVKLLSFAQQDYRTKSRGGTGTDGITWKKLAPATIKRKNSTSAGKENATRKTTKGGKARPGIGSSAIGVDSGLQQNSASPGFKGGDGKGGNVLTVTEHDVTVGYGREYSKYFDDQRPLLPTRLPEAWQKSIDELVTRGVERIVREGLK